MRPRWWGLRAPWLPMALACTILLLVLAALLLVGLGVPRHYYSEIVLIGQTPSGNWVTPPFSPMTEADLYSRNGLPIGRHLFILGSDGGGRDLLALIAHGALPSLELVVAGLLGRFLVGLLAGTLMAMGAAPVRTLSRGMGRWFAGLPYLAFAIVLVQVLAPYSRFWAFAIAMAVVGWRDVAEITAEQVEQVLAQPYTEAAHALGSQGWTYFRRHVVPNLTPALAVELPFQASAILVLLAELGYLNVYLGSRLTGISFSSNVVTYLLPQTPELGALLADARAYILMQFWVPVLVPALAIALLALAFELLGWSVRIRSRSTQARVI